MKSLRKIWTSLLGSTLLIQTALGEGGTVPAPETHELENPLKAEGIADLISTVGKFLIGISTALLTIFILWGAFQIMTSSGSPERVEKGKKTIFYAVLGFIVLLVAGGVGALVADILGGNAVPIDGAEVGDAPVTSFEGLIDVLVTISRWMFGILIALSIVMILYSAFLYMFSMGSDDRIKKAKDTLLYAIIAVAIAVFAGGVGVVVQSFFGDSVPGGGGDRRNLTT